MPALRNAARAGEAFLKAGILGEDQASRDTRTGTPQGGVLTPPTQLAIGPCFALRVGFGAGVGAVGGVASDRDGVSDRDLVGADEDVFDEQAQDSLAFFDGRSAGLGAQSGEEAFEVVGEFEVDLPVGELAVEASICWRRLVSRDRSSGIRERSSSREISSSWKAPMSRVIAVAALASPASRRWRWAVAGAEVRTCSSRLLISVRIRAGSVSRPLMWSQTTVSR